MHRTFTLACVLIGAFATAAPAEIAISDPYARAAMPGAPSGAAFMTIRNSGSAPDRLVGVRSDIAERVELHTHIEDAQGVMRMREVEDGFPIPADGEHRLQRGGDHVMFLGLRQTLAQGDRVSVTLIFEQAGEVAVDIPVDLERRPAGGAMMHGGMDHGEMDHDGMAPAD